MRNIFLLISLSLPVQALIIKVDYRFDTNGFFTPEARVAMEAAAARWSRVIDQTLLPVNLVDNEYQDHRFKLFHPSSGEIYELSAAASEASDFIVTRFSQPAADEYLGGFTLEEDEWVLFVGSRPLAEAARGGPLAAGINTADVFDNPKSFINRGFNKGRESLTVFGGSISFNLNGGWNFNLAKPGGLDFYTIALHEIGHGLGLNAKISEEWTDLVSEEVEFTGTNAISAYQRDTGEAVKSLKIVSESAYNYHWADDVYDSIIFPLGEPNYIGTLGPGKLQDLLMEPVATFSSVLSRFEITNVDVGGLQDIGWSVITGDPPEGPEIPLEFSRSAEGGLALNIPTEAGAVYTIQTSIDGFNWLDVSPPVIGDGTSFSWTDGQEGFIDSFGPASGLEGKFYRIRMK